MDSRRLRNGLFLLIILVLTVLFSVSLAETAADITAACEYKTGSGRKSFNSCKDRKYDTYWQSNGGNSAWVEITAPKGETISGVWLQQYEHNHSWCLLIPDGDNWTEAARTEGVYLSEYLPVPEGTTRVRVANPKGVNQRFLLAELHVYGTGDTPREVQQWNPPADKADLMLLVAHPDDEVLWFGGALPRYAGEEEKICQVCMMVPTMPYRRLELLDCLWTCGVKNYPVWGGFRDAFSYTLKNAYKRWSKNHVYEVVTGWIRRFKPEVLLTHDINGEYGHGAHRVCADAAMHCIELAANGTKFAKSAKEYGLWDVPKTYIHLYSENVIDMGWDQKLAAFGGQTGYEVAVKAFLCHVSQQKTEYRVENDGPWDCSLFGLYRSLVGPDEEKDDFFEHLD